MRSKQRTFEELFKEAEFFMKVDRSLGLDNETLYTWFTVDLSDEERAILRAGMKEILDDFVEIWKEIVESFKEAFSNLAFSFEDGSIVWKDFIKSLEELENDRPDE